MNHRALISVIMPCYNAVSFVEESVRCVLDQTHGNVELLVVDDGSTDGSQEILRQLGARYPERIRIYHQENKGPYPARNLALKHARGEYAAFLDADDFWHQDCLAKLYDAMMTSHADLAYCGWQNVGEGAPGTQPHVPPKYEEDDPVTRFLKGCPWPIHAALIRREIIDAVNGFSERCFSAMDYDLWLRILAVTRKMIRVPEVLSFYRWHDKGQISSIKWKQVLNAWQVRQDFVRNNPALVSHIPPDTLRTLRHQCLLDAGYKAYWKRDLASSQKLFRQALKAGYWQLKDLKYLLPALLAEKIYRSLILHADK
ncbi:MAG: glycosyltransferase family 2 protein [Pseudomonadota bacterium]